MRRIFIILALGLGLIVLPARSEAATLAQQMSGRVLLQTGMANGAWYVYPVTLQRYWIGTTTQANTVLRKLSLAVSAESLAAIPTHGDGTTGSLTLRAKLSGRIIRLSGTTDLWYVWPKTREKYALGTTPLAVLKPLWIPIGPLTIAQIPIAPGYDAPKTPVNGLLRSQRNVATARGTFLVDVATLDLKKTTLKVMTDTSLNKDCGTGCLTLALKSYTDRRKAAFGLHGTYFCPAEYASCVGQTGSYYYPVLNSFSRVMINSKRLKYTNEPMVTFDYSNTPKFYRHAKDYLGSDLFAPVNLSGVRAAISNGPALVIQGSNVVNPTSLDTKQRTVRSYRGVLGWKGSTLYLFIVRGATVVDSGAVAAALGLDYAINLDGGGSTAMAHNGRYVLGPGRNIPNAILLVP